jgi:predicted amidophosphoribosyltransferase
VEYGLLQRSVATGQQARLKRAERALNVQSAFSARQARRALASTQLWLVDDVITTGQTIDACAQALEQAGYTVAGALCCALSGDP